jgi:predicted transcriptional regulator
MRAKRIEDLLSATARIAAAYLSKNAIAPDQLAPVLRDIHSGLVGLGQPKVEEAPATPAVPVRRSVKDDVVICLECGKPMRMLKRHLSAEHGLSVHEYKAKWSLGPDYPVVAPAYAKARSETAKRLGLGRKLSARRSQRKAEATDAPE